MGDLVFNQVGSTLQAVAVENTGFDTTVNLSSAANVTELDLGLIAAGSISAAGVVDRAAVTMNGVETVNVVAVEADSYVTLHLADTTALTVEGDADLQARLGAGTTSLSSIDASLFNGDLDLIVTAQTQVIASTDISVTSGSGNDTIDVSLVSQDYIVTLGAGDDIVVDTAITNFDTIVGGEGTDTLSTDYGSASLLTTANGVNGIDVLELTDSLAGSITLATVDSTITSLDLDSTTALNAAATVTGGAGTLNVDLGVSYAGNTQSVLGDALTTTDTGTGTTDTVVFTNNAVNSTTGAALNVFAAKNITSTGYENVEINTGSASNVAQTIGTLTITADSASAPVSLTAEGTSSLNVTSLSTNSTGLTTVDASGLAAQAAGTNSFTLSGTTLGTTAGTLSVTGTGGDDVVAIGNVGTTAYASTVYGGAGNDALTGGTAADQLHGEAGNDSLTGAGGNDTIRGGEGNDTISEIVGVATRAASIDGGTGNDIVSLDSTLTQYDDVDGGEGVDTLAVTGGITGTTGVGVTNFETLSTTVDQNLTNAINNSWTNVLANATGVDVINALSTTNTFQVNQNAQGGAASFTRLTDTGTDSLTLATVGTNALAFNGSLTAFVANEEESITIDVSNGASSVAGSLTVDTLTAADLTSLTLTGDHSVNITNAVGSTKLATVDATGITASSAPLAANTVSVNASNSTVAVTMTGSTTVANTFTGGVNADSITGGNLADNLTGGNGADTLVGNGGNDVLLGGAGADSINGGAGTDAITAGTQADVVTLTADSQTDTVTQAASDSVAASATAFQGATFVAGDTITFGNGVDVVNNFQAGALASGGDVLSVGTIASTSLLNSATGSLVIGWLSGTYANGVFTVAANGIGADTLVLQGSTLSGATTRAVVLAGVDSDNLVDANFAGSVSAAIIPLFSSNAYSFTAGSTATNRLYIAANGIIYNDSTYTTQDPNVAPQPATGFDASTMTSADFSNVLGGYGVNFNVTGATSTSLNSVVGSSGSDNFIFATQAFGAANSTVNGGSAGTDTVVFTTSAGGTINGTASASGMQIANIDAISLTAGSSGTVTLGSTVSSAVAVSNASTTAAAAVDLGAGAAHTYTSASSGIDNVTLGLTGQTATLTNGGTIDVVANSVAGATVSTDGTTLTVSDLAGLAGNFSTSASATSTLAGAIDGATTVTLGSITGFDVLSVGQNTGAVAVTSGATNSLTSLSVDTTSANVTYNATLAQLDGLTSAVSASSSNTFKLAATAAIGGTLNLAGMTLTNVDTLDIDLATSNSTISGTAALVGSFATIKGVGSGGTTTLTSTNDAALDLHTGYTITQVDNLSFAGSGATNVLTLAQAQLSATNFTAITGTGASSYLVFSTDASTDLTTTTVSGMAVVNVAAGVNDTLTLDSASISGATTLIGDAGSVLSLSTAGDYSNITLTSSDFTDLKLASATAVTVDTGMFAGAVDLVDTAAAGVDATLAVNMDTTSLNLSTVVFGATNGVDTTVTGTTGNDTIYLNASHAAGSTMTYTGNGGNDVFNGLLASGNATGADNVVIADAVSITDFGAAGDQFVMKGSELVGVSLTSGTVATGTLNWNTGSKGFALITGAAVSDFSDVTAFAAAVGAVTTDILDSGLIAVQNAAGTQVGVYSVVTATGISAAAITTTNANVTLVGVIDVTSGTFGATNIGLY